MSEGDRARSRAWAEIDRAALAHNIDVLKSHFGRTGRSRIMAVVKADAYGHGVSLIAPLCYAAGLRDFGIAAVEEGRALRALLPADAALYLLATALPADAPDIVAYRLISLVSDDALGDALSQAAIASDTTAEAHLDVDTGIGRAGIGVSDAPALLRRLDALPGVRMTGVSTHFASADEDVADAQAQHALFAAFIADLEPAPTRCCCTQRTRRPRLFSLRHAATV